MTIVQLFLYIYKQFVYTVIVYNIPVWNFINVGDKDICIKLNLYSGD